MPATSHILHLEDSARDAALIRDLLETECDSFDITHVADQKQFEKALERPSFDLILCDFNLSDFDGLSALKLVKARFPETPVIIVSGAIDAGEAGECLKAGATDYLLKQRLERLPSAIQRALEEAQALKQRQLAEAKLRENEERFRQLAEQSKDGFWFLVMNPEQITYVSPAVELMWGLPAERFYQDPRVWMAGIHPEDQPRVGEAWESYLRNSTSRFEVEYRVVRPDGTMIWVQDSGTPIRDSSGALVRIAGLSRDISERKRAEEEIRSLNASLEQRVAERTLQLTEANAELEAFNQAMVGREQRLIELKEEINALCRELGREPEYPPVWKDQF